MRFACPNRIDANVFYGVNVISNVNANEEEEEEKGGGDEEGEGE